MTPKAFDLLTYLAERPNRLVPNDEIVGALWAHEYLVYLPNRTLPNRVRALIDFLVARFGSVPPWEAGW